MWPCEVGVVVPVEVIDARNDELIVEEGRQDGHHLIEHLLDFLLARTGKHRNNLALRIKVVALVEINAFLVLSHRIGGWVADVVNIITESVIKLLLEG